MIPPLALPAGGTIGVVSPSSPGSAIFKERWNKGVEALGAAGFHVVPGALAGRQQGYRSAPALTRAAELNDFLRNPDIHAIMSCIGGWNSGSLLPYIDYEAFLANPKPVVGHSDFTAVLLALYKESGVITFHGPAVLPSFGEWPRPFEQTVATFSELVTCGNTELVQPASWTEEYIEWTDGAWKTRERKRVPNEGWLARRGGCATGPLLGGNLDTLCTILGTRYCPDFNGSILFFEDTEKHMRDYERNLNQLCLHGIFEQVSGLVVGKHALLSGEDEAIDRVKLLMEFLPDRDFPVLDEVDIGHTAPMLTLPIGVLAVLDADACTIRLLEKAVR